MPNSDFSQLKRFTDLRSHYLEHIEEAKLQAQTVSFVQFLQLHFISPADHQDANHEEDHHKLPLQTFDFSINFLVFLSPASPSHPIFSKNIPQGLEMRYFRSQGFPTSVFHPPTTS